MSDVNNSNVPVEKTGEQEGGAAAPKKTVTRRQVLAMAGCGVAGLVVGGVLASWGVTERSIASGRIDIRTTPTKLIVTDRALLGLPALRDDVHAEKRRPRLPAHRARARA